MSLWLQVQALLGLLMLKTEDQRGWKQNPQNLFSFHKRKTCALGNGKCGVTGALVLPSIMFSFSAVKRLVHSFIKAIWRAF